MGDSVINFDFVRKWGIIYICPYMGDDNPTHFPKNDITLYENEDDYYSGKAGVLNLETQVVKFSVPLFNFREFKYIDGLYFLDGIAYCADNGNLTCLAVYLNDFDIDFVPQFNAYYASNMKFLKGQSNIIYITPCTLFAVKEECTDFLKKTEKIKKLNSDEKAKQITITISETDDIKNVAEKILKEFSKK